MSHSHFTALLERMRELADLRSTTSLLHWDQQVMMPRGGAEARADALATIERISHDLMVSPETGRLLEAAAEELDGAAPDSDQAAAIKVTRRRYEKARRVPTELAAEIARAASTGQEAWVAARAANDFQAFRPHLERNLKLARRYVECFDYFERPYDALLDDYEPGMTTAHAASLFAELRSELVPMIATLTERADHVEDSCLHGHFPVTRQRELVASVVAQMGFDRDSWRMDDAVHPFASGLSPQDVRITTRWDEEFFASGLYGAMHECGHGLYEAGIPAALRRSPVGFGESLGLHESQSRLWENMVGRGWAFCGVLAPRIAQAFELGQLDGDTLYRAVNRTVPSFIRVEADEATYGLHVVLRFELEQELVEGRLSAAELPEAWNARFKEYLGLDVPDDARGVLQDIHWAAGLMGYFPTYALGNLIAGQLWERAHRDIGDLDDQIAAGELSGLREWLREHVHRHGSKFLAEELLEREVGAPIEVGPFVSYLKRKLSDVYDVTL